MISSSENRVSYDGDGLAKEFAYQFKILEKSDIKVILVKPDGSTQILNKDYYVDAEKSVAIYPGYAPGAEIPESERPPILPTGWRLVLYREVPITQLSKLLEQWPFNIIEDGLDKLTIICQQLKDELMRSLHIDESHASDVDTTVPWQPGKSFRIADDGKKLETTEDPAKVIPTVNSIYNKTVADANNILAQAKAQANSAADSASASANSVAEADATLANIKSEAAKAEATLTGIAADAKESAYSAAGSADKAQGYIDKADYGFIKRNTAYAVGDIAYSTQLPAGYYLECVTAGTTGNTEPSISVESESVSDGTVKWGVKNLQDASKLGLPVGFEAFTTNPNLQAGWLPLLGGEYSRTTYADLWAWVQTQAGYLIEESAWQAKAAANGGNVPFYSKGDGTTTFRVPALKCWVRGAGSISEIGGYLTAGLPNIEGEAGEQLCAKTELSCTGALYQSLVSAGGEANGNYKYVSLGFDASLSNPIYGSSNTVQPPSIVGLWCVKAYGTITNVGSTDVANISTGLTQAEMRISLLETSKVDKEGAAWVVESYRNDTEWYRVWSDGWLEQGGQITDNRAALTFLKPFVNANYYINALPTQKGKWGGLSFQVVNMTATSAELWSTISNSGVAINNWQHNNIMNPVWYACGQGA